MEEEGRIGLGTSPNPGSTITQTRIKVTQGLFAAAPYIRLHQPVSDNVVLFAELSAAYGGGKGKVEISAISVTYYTSPDGVLLSTASSSGNKQDIRQTTWGATLSPGLIFFPSPSGVLR